MEHLTHPTTLNQLVLLALIVPAYAWIIVTRWVRPFTAYVPLRHAHRNARH